MQTIRRAAARPSGHRVAAAWTVLGTAVLVLAFGSCGGNGRCSYDFPNVPDVKTCNTLGDEFACNFATYPTCDYTFTGVPNRAACTQQFRETSAQFNCGGSTFEGTTMTCTVTGCLVCSPTPAEPRCRLSGCLNCSGSPLVPTQTPGPRTPTP